MALALGSQREMTAEFVQGESRTRFDRLAKQACATDRTKMEEKKGKYTFLGNELQRAPLVSRIMSA